MKATKVEILRESVAKIVPMLSGKGVRVTQIGMQAFVQYHPKTLAPQVVNIPFVPDSASDDLLIAIQGFVDHEVAHILFSDPKYLPMAKSAKVGGLYGIIEDSFIERQMKKAYAGSKANLAETWRFAQERVVNPAIEKAKLTGNTKMVFQSMLVPIVRYWSGQTEVAKYIDPHLPLVKDYIDAIGPDLIAQVPLIKSSEDGFRLAVAMHNRLEELERRIREDKEKEKSDSDEESDEDGEGGDGGGKRRTKPTDESSDSSSDDGDDFDDSEGEPGEEPDEESEDSDEKSDEGSEEDSDSEDDESDEDSEGSEDEESEGDSDEESEDESDEESEDSDEDSEEAEDEKPTVEVKPSTIDDLRSVFEESKDFDSMMDVVISEEIKKAVSSADYYPITKDFDTIEEFKPRSVRATQDARLATLEGKVSAHVAPIQRHLERCIAAKSHSRMISGYRSGRINPGALHRIPTGDERLFRRKFVSRTKDAAVSLVVDMSGSMGGSKIELANQAAFAMSVSLDRLNITHEVIGFTTKSPPSTLPDGRDFYDVAREHKASRISRIEAVYMPILKPFNSRLTGDRRRAFACADYEVDLSNNIDGESIEYAGYRLANRKEARKIMIVLSDGQPCASGDHVAQSVHLKRVVKRLEGSGMDVLGIGIQTDSVRDYYKKSVVIYGLDELATTVMGHLEQMLLEGNN